MAKDDIPPPLTNNIEEAIADLEHVEGMWPKTDIDIEMLKEISATKYEQRNAQSVPPFPETYEDYKAARRAYRAIFAPSTPPTWSRIELPNPMQDIPILTIGNVISQLYALIEEGLDPSTPLQCAFEDPSRENQTMIFNVRKLIKTKEGIVRLLEGVIDTDD